MNIFNKRILSILMSLVCFLTSLTIAPTEVKAESILPNNGFMPLNDFMPMTRGSSRDGQIYYENQRFEMENESGRGLLVSIGGNNDTANFAPHQITWNNPDTDQVYQAYCINAAYPGYGDIADYDVSIMEFGENVQFSSGGSNGNGHLAGDTVRGTQTTYIEALWGAVTRGYPSRTAEEILGGTAANFGVTQEVFDYSAYVATKFAIWSLVYNNYTVDKWSVVQESNYPIALKQAILNAIKDIYDYSLNFKKAPTPKLSFTAGKSAINVSTKAYETVYTIGSENIVSNTKMYVRSDLNNSPFPDGMYIADMNGQAYPKGNSGRNEYIIPAGTREFKAIVPIPKEEKYNKEYSITLVAQIPMKTLVFGKTKTKNVQDYILAGNGYATSSDDFKIVSTTEDTEESEGYLDIIKLSAKDDAIPLKGATFDVYNSQGQLIDTGTTDASGKWKPNINKAGTYTIVERSTNPDYQLTEPTKMVVLVEENKTTTVTFRNFPKQNVTVWKEDADTGKPLLIRGLVFNIYISPDCRVYLSIDQWWFFAIYRSYPLTLCRACLHKQKDRQF